MSSPMRFASALLILSLGACQAPPRLAAGDDGSGAAGLDAPVPELRAIGAVQGRGARSPLLGRQVTVQGVVVGNFATGLQGVFVQSEHDDGDPLTAEGIFIARDAQAEPKLHSGDRVEASGRVSESGDEGVSLTTLRDAVVRVIGQGELAPTELRAPPEDWERYEGMLLRIAAPLTVSGNDSVASYGEILTSFDGRLVQPTEIAPPGPEVQRLAAGNARRRLLLDDARGSKDPRSLWFLAHGLGETEPLRAGSTIEGATGVLDQRRGVYRLQLTEVLSVQQAPRPPAPSVAGDTRIASFNLLNLFNGDGKGGGFPTERGALTPEQYARQQSKLVAVVQALAPDIAALMEVENDGSDPDSTLAQFVAALNHAGPIRDYALVDTGARLGGDSIRVAMIYRRGRVHAGGNARLEGGPFTNRSRVTLAQAFRVGRGPAFVIAANHFKSKGCGHAPDQAQGADADQHDGQGCWNPVRVESARRVAEWLATDPTHAGAQAPRLLIGDLNAHAQEDPLRLLRAAGYADAFERMQVAHPYSFVFSGEAGRLDHALLDARLAARLRGAAEWHLNSDEAEYFDYHNEAAQGPYRASDHDPILLGLDLRE
ncbi:MAG: ExeM/NucH family extracellular endonuclease [Arenimonas sp.]